ncbi:uncharacterized protein LOC141578987 isoform X7 [Camelus bactrianus]|uniref:Uncharacterized protein LOC141578906 isoform X3 n=2 Tax=Camelus bactrianus TaxID=9837 RepID=A0AC58R3C3_CAMBA
MYLPAANPRRPLMHHILAKILAWGGVGRRRFARCWTPGATSAAVEAGRRSPGELGPGRRRRRRRRRLWVGVRSRELLHFFSPPRPGLGATSAARDLPEVRLQKPDARLQLNHRKWAGCAEGAEAAAKAATEGAVPGQPVNLFPSQHLLSQFRRTPFSSLSFSWEVTF